MQRFLQQRIITQSEAVKRDKHRRSLPRQLIDARLRGVDALLEGREIQHAILILDDDLSVEHAALRQRRAQRRDELGKVPLDWFRVPRADLNLIAVSENNCPK